MSYIVCGQEFKSFEDVVEFAWAYYKIDIVSDLETYSEEERQEACECLTNIIDREDDHEEPRECISDMLR